MTSRKRMVHFWVAVAVGNALAVLYALSLFRRAETVADSIFAIFALLILIAVLAAVDSICFLAAGRGSSAKRSRTGTNRSSGSDLNNLIPFPQARRSASNMVSHAGAGSARGTSIMGRSSVRSGSRSFVHYLVIASTVWLASAICVDAQTSLSASDDPWIASSQNQTVHNNPYRTTESHVKSGNRTIDQKIMEIRGADGQYGPYVRVETETIQESPELTRSITRTYNPGQDRNEHLTQVTEVETRNSGGVSQAEKRTSSIGYDGKPQLKEREVTVTAKSGDTQTTQTTVYLLGIIGQFAASMQINQQERTKPDGTTETRTETLLPDVNGRWQAYEIRDEEVRKDARGRTIDERLSRRDYSGNISPVSEVITTEKNATNQFTSTSQTYSADIPGLARDGRLHALESSTTVQTIKPGRITTEREIVRPDPGEKDLSTVFKTTDVLVQTSSGTEQTLTVTAQYPDGQPSVVSLETRKSDKPLQQRDGKE